MSVAIYCHHGSGHDLNQWRSLIQAFRVRHWYVNVPLGQEPHPQLINTFKLVREPPYYAEFEVVVFDRTGDRLETFQHPRNALYVFGDDKLGVQADRLALDRKKVAYSVVAVPGIHNIHAVSCGAMLFYDRCVMRGDE